MTEKIANCYLDAQGMEALKVAGTDRIFVRHPEPKTDGPSWWSTNHTALVQGTMRLQTLDTSTLTPTGETLRLYGWNEYLLFDAPETAESYQSSIEDAKRQNTEALKRGPYLSGPDCVVCGCRGQNPTHFGTKCDGCHELGAL